jgi:tetratricopeptide (TPR) repeat protein
MSMVIKATALALLGLFVAWRVIATNMADYFVQGRDADEPAAALKWDKGQGRALLALGTSLTEVDAVQASAALEVAIKANPTEGRGYAALGAVLEKQGDLAGAERAMTTAASLAPRRTDVQAEVASFYMRQNNLAKSMEHWNVVLTFNQAARPKLFPQFLIMVQDPATHAAFAPLLKQEVKWWPEFFAHVAASSPNLETVRGLFAIQAKGPNASTPHALRAYLSRLQREGYWEEAYFAWLNSLEGDQIRNVANLFNGGFEQPLSNLGFDWISMRVGQVLVETAPTYGIGGQRALHVVFRGQRVAFRHFGQYLLLPPGTYSLKGRARPESLEAPQGIRWALQCLGSDDVLGTSERFAGTDQWRHFGFQFVVPAEDCPVQALRLELVGRIALDFDARGGIWFDDLSVEPLMP